MPTKPAVRCTNPQCRQLHHGKGRCPTCLARDEQGRDQRRGTTDQRGYGWAYQQARAKAVPGQTHCATCGEPFTEDNPATGGHVRDRRAGGTLEHGIKAECRLCNYGWRRTSTRQVTLVTGPPCSGKSTYVSERAHAEDVVLDFDQVAQQMGSPARWMHGEDYMYAANQHMAQAMEQLAAAHQVTAWVVRCIPEGNERERIAQALGAKVVLLLPGQREVLLRASRDRRPRGTRSAILGWYRRYTPAGCDVVVG